MQKVKTRTYKKLMNNEIRNIKREKMFIMLKIIKQNINQSINNRIINSLMFLFIMSI